VKVRIFKRPAETLDGVDLNKYAPGLVYDVSRELAEYLVLEGFAKFEMRRTTRPGLKQKEDRRRPKP
jgi:hypothetical protein